MFSRWTPFWDYCQCVFMNQRLLLFVLVTYWQINCFVTSFTIYITTPVEFTITLFFYLGRNFGIPSSTTQFWTIICSTISLNAASTMSTYKFCFKNFLLTLLRFFTWRSNSFIACAIVWWLWNINQILSCRKVIFFLTNS